MSELRKNKQTNDQNSFCSSTESLRKQKVHLSKQLQVKKQVISVDTRASSCKSSKQFTVLQSQEKENNIQERSFDIITSADELFSSHNLGYKSNNKNQKKLKNQLQNQFLNQQTYNKQDKVDSLYQPIQCSTNNKQQYFDKQNAKNNSFEKRIMESSGLCSTQRQCIEDQEQVSDLKIQINKLQQENTTLRNIIKKKENQFYLEKQQNDQQIQQKQQLKQINQQLSIKLKEYEEIIQSQSVQTALRLENKQLEAQKKVQEVESKQKDQIEKLAQNFQEKQSENIQLKNEVNQLQAHLKQQLEKTNSQNVKIKNLEQLVAEYSKIEQKLFELEDEQETLKQENTQIKDKLNISEQFELKMIQVLNEIKKTQQQSKSKVNEFGQIIDAYLKLTECLITEKEPPLDVLVGHRRKRNSFLEVKKQDDNSALMITGQLNIQQKLNEICDFIVGYQKGSIEKVQAVLDQSRSLLDKLSDYYMLKHGTGVI